MEENQSTIRIDSPAEERVKQFIPALEALQREYGCAVIARQEVEQQGALTIVRLVVRIEPIAVEAL